MVRFACLLFLTWCAPRLWCADVLTQHNDNARSGLNAEETVLTPGTVTPASFGKLYTLTLNASVNGQPLYVHGLSIAGAQHNVLFAYTSTGGNKSPCAIYAFDADVGGEPLWKRDLGPSAECTTSTPAIDAARTTMYLVSKDKDNSGAIWLHAIDLNTGAERSGSPLQIAARVPGTGAASLDGRLSFVTKKANCRPGVLVVDGLITIAFANAGDGHPFHGWVLSYAYDGTTFTQKGVFCTTPDADAGKPGNYSKDGGGIWQSGKGLASDGTAIYCISGNGNFSADTGGRNYGMCFLKLRLGDLQLLDWFTEAKVHKDSDDDNDIGNTGPVLIPGTTVMFAGATKYGRSYLVDCAQLGHFSDDHDTCLQTLESPALAFPNGQNPVAWNAGAAGTFVYVWNRPQGVAQYAYDPAKRAITGGSPLHQGGTAAAGAGGGLTITANHQQGGILWCLGSDAVVRAVDALDVSKELWNSAQNAERDALGKPGKWQFPTVADGKAFMPSGNGTIAVYGLLGK